MMEPFWQQKSLTELSRDEWESLCDGCGRCCLVKLEDEDNGDVYFTDVACKLLDTESCRCLDYDNRLSLVDDCVKLDAGQAQTLAWLPATCAYRLVAQGDELPDWHPLVSGDRNSVKLAGISVAGRVISQNRVPEEDLEEHIIQWID